MTSKEIKQAWNDKKATGYLLEVNLDANNEVVPIAVHYIEKESSSKKNLFTRKFILNPNKKNPFLTYALNPHAGGVIDQTLEFTLKNYETITQEEAKNYVKEIFLKYKLQETEFLDYRNILKSLGIDIPESENITVSKEYLQAKNRKKTIIAQLKQSIQDLKKINENLKHKKVEEEKLKSWSKNAVDYFEQNKIVFDENNNFVLLNEENFPDENFRRYLKRKFECKTDRISKQDIKKTDFLHIANNDIKNLKGIEFFTQLTYLDCSANNISNLDLSKLVKLTILNCYFNKLTSLDVSKNKELKSLECFNNQLTSLDLSKNIKLDSLNCNSNKLTSLDVSKHKELKALNCASNKLTSLDVSNNVKLQVLDCQKNKLTSLDISKNCELTNLICSRNILTSLDVSNNTELKYIGCGENQLTSLDLTKNKNLIELNCDSSFDAIIKIYTSDRKFRITNDNIFVTNYEIFEKDSKIVDSSDSEVSQSVSVQDIELSKINTDPSRFQNRQNEFSSESRDRIVNAYKNGEFDFAKFDPISIWKDPNDNKFYVLSGHSRFAAFKEIAKLNKKFEKIPSRIFSGTEKQAIDFALNSNVLSTKETDMERAIYYHKDRQTCEIAKHVNGLGDVINCEKQTELKCRENEGKNAPHILNLSYLNPEGYLADSMKRIGADKGNDDANIIRTVADWVGDIRKRFPEVSDNQETEIAKYLLNGGYGSKSTQFKNKEKFILRFRYCFDRWKQRGADPQISLNLANSLSKSVFENEYDQRLEEARIKRDAAKAEYEEKHRKYWDEVAYGRMTQEKMLELEKPLIDYYNRCLDEYKRIMGTKEQVKAAASAQMSLFGGIGIEIYKYKKSLLGTGDVVSMDSNCVKNTSKSEVKKLINWFNKNLNQKDFYNPDKDIQVMITGESRDEIFYGRRNQKRVKWTKTLMTSIYYLPELIESMVYRESIQTNKKQKNGELMIFDANASIGNQLYRVKLTVFKYIAQNGDKRNVQYSIKVIE